MQRTIFIKKSLDTTEKLSILSQHSQYDLACSCGTKDDEHRRRSKEDKWIYPVALPNGGTTFLFKTLLSNECVNDCKYCPLRATKEQKRCRLQPEELAKTFLDYYRSRKVSGIFLSSGVIGKPDITMSLINQAARLLRRMNFKGYMHLKVIPGSSEAAIRETVSLASAVSLNIEVPGEENFKALCQGKNYQKDIIESIKFISKLRKETPRYSNVKQTTQFVVGAYNETDKDIVKNSWQLYKESSLSRVYFSAYQRGLGEPDIPGEHSPRTNADLLTREHRLYQLDWLIRKYGFSVDEFVFEKDGNLSLANDPKEVWAASHPEFFPVNINQDGRERLLRVPGLGEVAVGKILNFRQGGRKIRSLDELGKMNKRIKKAEKYIRFS